MVFKFLIVIFFSINFWNKIKSASWNLLVLHFTFHIVVTTYYFFTCLLFKSDFDLLVDLFLFLVLGVRLVGGPSVTGTFSVTSLLRGLSKLRRLLLRRFSLIVFSQYSEIGRAHV